MKKMTDNEVVKALECCLEGALEKCEECPLKIPEDELFHCLYLKQKLALDLINRQKAEIERLQESGKEAVSCFTRMESLYKIKCKELEVAKSEAIKEFEKYIIDKSKREIIHVDDIPDLVKEIDEKF